MAKFLLVVFILSSLAAEKACSYAGAQSTLPENSETEPSTLQETADSTDAANDGLTKKVSMQPVQSESPQENAEENEENSPVFLQANTAEDVTADCVKAHNAKRVGNLKHPLDPVKQDEEAVAQALKYMKETVANGCPFKHSGAGGFGENLYASGGTATCEGAVHAWYSEIKVFNGKYPGGNWTLAAGHFTQVMWAKSTGIGCARTVGCTNGKHILVCNYKPPGNYKGAAPFSEEVWNSIMDASDSSTSPILTSSTWIFIAVVTAVTSLTSSLL